MEDKKCELIDSFAILVQILMASLALASLLYKRSIETPQRPMLIWAMDTAKQAIAASLIHFANILLSYITSVLPQQSTNPCVWYFLNLALDTTVGVYILYIFLSGIHSVAEYFNIKDIEMGHYGHPPRVAYINVVYTLDQATDLIFDRMLVVTVTLVLVPIFGIIATWILSPLSDERYQVIFVMFIFPLIMNIIQAWLIDKVIKGKVGYIQVDTEDEEFSPDSETPLPAAPPPSLAVRIAGLFGRAHVP
ncbi:hypothetical protein HDV06_001717 [Boothiomyces sp. JEL0866]|nr:hypothetical protein HDV06_001717 [Boothiomyces sp. JEL0866]